ncbi:MAG: hypothetical protein R2770_10260 [Acidimicrobiales bacterium]
MISVLWFLVLAFPKAGFYLGAVPVTFASLVVMGYAAYHFLYPGYPPKRLADSRRFNRIHLILVWVLLLGLLVRFEEMSATDLAAWLLFAASPLAYHAGLRVRRPRVAVAAVLIAMIAVGCYGVAQNLLGVEETAVPGLTHVLGEDLLADNPITTRSGSIKSPSTFHNGNLAAAMLLTGLTAVGYAWVKGAGIRHSKLLVAGAAVAAIAGIGVSLSRSAAFGALVALAICMWPSMRPRSLSSRVGNILLGFSVSVGGAAALYLATGWGSFLVDRFVGDTLGDPTASGRTQGWSFLVDHLTNGSPAEVVGRLVFGDWTVDAVAERVEGVATVIANFGLPALLAFVALAALPMRQIRERAGREGTLLLFGLIAASASWLVDNTFLFPPTLMNWFLLAGLAVQLSSGDSASAGAIQHHSDRRLVGVS